MTKQIPHCPDCGYTDIRMRKRTGVMFCRHCGYMGKKEGFYGIAGTRAYRCPNCESPNLLASIKGTISCQRCGYTGDRDEFKREEI